MSAPDLARRRFVQGLSAALIGALAPVRLRADVQPRVAAAIQMSPVLGDADANLAQAEQLIDEAARRGARSILLPEMFTSAAAFHDAMLDAIRPLDGAPARLLRDKARQYGASVGGSFLAREGDRVRNSFLLFMPDGSVHRHDKDQPTYWESCYYEAGDDDGVLSTREGRIGVALCWEMIRSRTLRRLRGRVDLVLAGSTWWTLPEEADADHPYRKANLEMLRQAPTRMARMLGVPVVHASHAGPFSGYDSPDLPDVAYNSSYLGETLICDARGRVLGRRGREEGAGVVLARIEPSSRPQPLEPVPERFWLPPQMPPEWKTAWTRWLERGADYYRQVTRVYLQNGEIPEYLPPYMRD